MIPEGMAGKNWRTTDDVSAKALISAWLRQIPIRAEERGEVYSTLADRVNARSSARTSAGTSSACMIRSKSETVGNVLPDSMRLILGCDMAVRTASLSPESPAALRNCLSVSARSLRC